jgi:transposase-like protein
MENCFAKTDDAETAKELVAERRAMRQELDALERARAGGRGQRRRASSGP